MSEYDRLHRFLFTPPEAGSQAGGARGVLVQLKEAWQAMLAGRDYPPAVAELLGELAAAAVLLSATLKLEGKLTLQVMAETEQEGRVHLLVVQVTSGRTLRGLAKWRGQPQAQGLALVGQGNLIMTIEPDEGARYQGVVALEGGSLAAALEGYFQRSEQIPTRLWLAADGQHAAGLLIQHMPGEVPAGQDELWNRIVALSATITPRELLEVPAETLLHRLYHEEDRQLFSPEPVRFACTCSREKVADMLRSMGREQLMAMLKEQGVIEVTCDFCNTRYRFDAVDAEALLHEAMPTDAGGLH